MRLRIKRRTIGVVGAAALAVPFMASAAFGLQTTHRVSVAGTHPAWAVSGHSLGAMSASTRIKFNVALPLRDAKGAEALLQSVSSPKSASYGKYLTAGQFNAKYAPTSAAVGRISAYLKSQGIHVTGVAAGNRWVAASGTVAQVNKAFSTTMRTYSVNGARRNAPATAISVPPTISKDVLAVSGLTQVLAHPNVVTPDNGQVGPSAAPATTSACSTYWDQYEQTMPTAYGKTSFPTYLCGYTPSQLRSAYDVQSSVDHGTNGAGITVAIIDAYDTPTILSDANAYFAAVGDAGFAPGQFIDSSDPSQWTMQNLCGDWSVEESLDVEAVHAMAPGATVHYVGANDCGPGIDDALNGIVQNQTANIVSNSYGYNSEDLDPAQVQLEHSIFVQGDIEGIGFYFSSGDKGDNTSVNGVPEPSYMSSDPLVTGVGGTSLAISSTGKNLFETGWGSVRDLVDYSTDTPAYTSPLPGVFYGGAGGGVSELFTEPWYQKGIVPNALAKSRNGTAMRVDPDISAVADPYTGFAFGYSVGGTFVLSTVGGTSLACPLIAGIQADASTHRLFPIGFANPLLYAVGGLTLRDVKPPASTVALTRRQATALVTLNADTSLTVTKGYDDVTGLGTPRGSLLILAETVLP